MRASFFGTLVLLVGLLGCGKKDEGASRAGGGAGAGRQGGDVPPPAPSALARPGSSVTPGTVDDPVSAAFFPRSNGTYVIDPAPGSVKTYGAKAKLSMDAVCTTAFDGECEVYKRFGLSRVVTLRYVDGAPGSAGVVEVVLSQFDTDGGAFGMFTKRVVADADPVSADAPKPIAATGAAALGGGRANAWRGPYLVELTYMNEQEKPAVMVKSSETVLTQLVKSITDRLAGNLEKPAPTRDLPEANMVPNGVQFFPKDAIGIKGLGPAAIGFYKEGEKRYRVLQAAPADEAGAKEMTKAVRGTPGALPVAGVGDEATQFVLQSGKAAPKAEWIFVRKGKTVTAVGDEEFALEAGQPLDKQTNRLTKDEKIAKLKTLAK